MKTLVLEKKALKHNLAVVREKAGPAAIYGVLTGDGGGAGTVELARLLREEGIGRFAVNELSDAKALRKAGLVEEEILMLRASTDRAELNGLMDLNVVCTIGSVESALALDSAAKDRSTVAEAHIQVDTGLGFGGFLAEEPEKIVNVYRNLTNVAISGIFTQIHSVHAGGRDANPELRAFEAVLEAVRQAKFETGTVHAAGSYALLHDEFARMDAVRAGSVVLGRCRRRRGDNLVRVGYGEASIQETRWLPKGHTVGSGGSLLHLRRPTRIAVVPVGYQNGLGVSRLRETGFWAMVRRWWRSRRMTMRVAGQKAPVLGGIGAVETLLDITDLKCSAGDTVQFDIDPLYAKGMTREYR